MLPLVCDFWNGNFRKTIFFLNWPRFSRALCPGVPFLPRDGRSYALRKATKCSAAG